MEDNNGNLNFCVRGVDFKMIKVEAGTFMMGELPGHQVTISNDYYIAEVPVTWKLWGKVMGKGYDCEDEPMMAIDWHDTYEFIKRLNEITGRQFRLPTEAEWEFAARGGNKSKGYMYSGSNSIDEVAWYDGNSHDNRNPNPEANTHPVKLKKPNELGLYDMSGNMWEQCHDGYAEYPDEAQTDPVGNPDSEMKVLRGGCHASSAESCRTTNRFYVEAVGDDDNIDLYDNTTYRLVLSPFIPKDTPLAHKEKDTIISENDVAGLPVCEIKNELFFIELSEKEASMLEGEIQVSIYNGGPYFHSRCALVKEAGAFVKRGTQRVCIDLTELMCHYYDAIYSKWESNSSNHDFEDFVIEVFEMKITKGNVRVNIELGS